MKKSSYLQLSFILILILSLSEIFAASPTITLTPLSPTTICATTNDTLLYSVNASNIPANTNIVVYQSTDSTFNPSIGQGDSIGYVPGNAIPRDTVNFGSCIKTLGIFIDACGVSGTEPKNEYMVLTSGNGIRVSDLAIKFDNANSNSGNNNDNSINTGTNPCGYKVPTPSLVTNLQSGSCNPSNVFSAGPTDSIPANAIIVVFTSDSVNNNYNISGLCNLGYPIYIVQSACVRTIGAFTNAASCSATATTRFRKTIAIDKRQNCQDNFIYDRCGLYNLDGTYAIRQQGTDTASVANNGIRRNQIDSCGGIDYTQLHFNSDTTLKFVIPTTFCNTGTHYIKAILKPQTQPETISNTIQFQYICNDVTATSNTTNICSGQNAIIDISSTNPNATFSWTISGGANIIGATAGTGNLVNQTLTYTGATKDSVTYNIFSNDNGCIKSTSVKVVVNNCDTCNTTVSISGNTTICNGNSTTLSVPQQYDSIRWSTGANTSTINVSQPGTYSVTAYLNGCSASDNVTVRENALTVTIFGNTIICNGNSTTLSVPQQYDSIRWSTGAITSIINISQPGTYSVTAYLNGCSATNNVTVRDNALTVSISGNTTICNGNSTILSVPQQYDSIRWNTGANTSIINVSQSGNYSVTAYLNGCSATNNVIVTETNVVVNITGTDVICGGTSVILTANGNFDSLRWNTNETTASINVSQQGTYNVVAYMNGCSAQASFNVARVSIDYSLNKHLDSICSSDTATFILFSGDLGVVPVDTFTFTQPGRYQITYITPNCGTFSDSVVVIAKSITPPNITGTLTFCAGQSTVLAANSGYDSYSWLPNGETTSSISVSTSGTYTVNVILNNCSASNSVNVTSQSAPTAFTLGNDTAFCGNINKVLSTGNSSTVWNTGTTAAQIIVTNAGQYIATISNTCGSVSDTININQKPIPDVNLGNDTAFCGGEINLGINNIQDIRNIIWNTGEQTANIIINSIGTYSVIVTNISGCSDSDAITINSNCENDLWLPNAFTPDGNGNNDIFYIRGNPQNTTIEKFVIYNRWGNKVFEANNILPDDKTKGWNGYYKDKIEQLEVYGYMVIAKFNNGEKRTLKGNVTLIK